MEYEKMLDRLYASLPESTKNHERFQMPAADSLRQGPKTIVRNFPQILKAINRGSKHICKFLAKETATATSIDDTGRLVLSGKFSNQQINDLIAGYTTQFVLCPECKKPDTKVIERQGVKVLKCEACGAIRSVKGL
ncbi:MAG: translation initiation factor IF-2 subunit beta [Candidatus Diapherotrites archaeon]|nr:translation initiation factor IF-2 subunit beta [Candidatus Diapherotrites archaeon]